MIRSLLCVAVLVTALSACAAPAPRPRTAVPEKPAVPRAAVSPKSTPSPYASVEASRWRRPRLGPYVVDRVVNGRQLDVDVEGEVRRVVALGIAVPRPGTCRARVAVRGARGLLAGSRVYLSTDPAVRTRREWYVWTVAGLYQARLLKGGFAAARVRPRLRYAALLRRAARTARTGHAGLWSSACAPRHRPSARPHRPRPHRPRPPMPRREITGPAAWCRDGSFSFSRHRAGTCAHHGGVRRWLLRPPP